MENNQLVVSNVDHSDLQGVIALNGSATLAHSMVMARLQSSPTLLPETIAEMVTGVSVVSRLSIRAAALCVEAIFDSITHSTTASLAFTRRGLITALGSAPTLHILNRLKSKGAEGDPSDDAFLQVLNKYSNLGAYVIHHTFSLVELFTVSSFYLTSSAILAGLFAAEESVRVFDSIFGSTESSRALAAIISLLVKEIAADPSFTPFATNGAISSITALTKTLTTFVCLQTATHRLTSRTHHTSTIYDCTIVIEGEPSKELSLLPPPQAFAAQPASDLGWVAPSRKQSFANQTHLDMLNDVEVFGNESNIDEPESSFRPTVKSENHSAASNDPRDYSIQLEEEETRTTTTTIKRTMTRESLAEMRPASIHHRSPTVFQLDSDDEWIELPRSTPALEQVDDPVDDVQSPSDRLQVLKTITRRLTQKKRTVRRVEMSASSGNHTRSASPTRRNHETVSSPSSDKNAENPFSKPLDSLRNIAKDLKGKRPRINRTNSKEIITVPEPTYTSDPVSTGSLFQMNATGSRRRSSFSQENHLNIHTEESNPATLSRKPSSQTLRSMVTTLAHSIPGTSTDSNPIDFPHDHQVANLQRFMRYSSAAYGQMFLRVFGIGKVDFNFPHTPSSHANEHSFAHHVGIDVQDILLSSWSDKQPLVSSKISPIVNFVTVDHSIRSVVLACRGSLGLSDILVDLTCVYERVNIPFAPTETSDNFYVHSGMWGAATRLQRGTVHETIRAALEKYPDYGLVLTGHSLGGGVSALLALLWSCPSEAFRQQVVRLRGITGRKLLHPPISTSFVTSFSSGLPGGRPISCFAYGPPCVTSPDLSRYCKGLVTSTIHNNDCVPTLSLGVLQDLKSMSMVIENESGISEEIISAVMGLYHRGLLGKRSKPSNKNTSEASKEGQEEGEKPETEIYPSEIENHIQESVEDAELNQRLWAYIKTMRAVSDNDKLYPPGSVYIVESTPVFVRHGKDGNNTTNRREARRVLLQSVENIETRFSEPIFSKTMLTDHSPRGYEQALDDLAVAVLV